MPKLIEEVETERIDAIPLDFAMLCVECGCVVRSHNDCPVCGSRSVMNLAKILDREE